MKRPCPIRLVWVRDSGERDPRRILTELAEHAAKQAVARCDGVTLRSVQQPGRPGAGRSKR